MSRRRETRSTSSRTTSRKCLATVSAVASAPHGGRPRPRPRCTWSGAPQGDGLVESSWERRRGRPGTTSREPSAQTTSWFRFRPKRGLFVRLLYFVPRFARAARDIRVSRLRERLVPAADDGRGGRRQAAERPLTRVADGEVDRRRPVLAGLAGVDPYWTDADADGKTDAHPPCGGGAFGADRASWAIPHGTERVRTRYCQSPPLRRAPLATEPAGHFVAGARPASARRPPRTPPPRTTRSSATTARCRVAARRGRPPGQPALRGRGRSGQVPIPVRVVPHRERGEGRLHAPLGVAPRRTAPLTGSCAAGACSDRRCAGDGRQRGISVEARRRLGDCRCSSRAQD